MEKSWNNHGILILNFCGNPDYLCSKNKGADKLRGYREADLRLCFRICKKPVFSQRGSSMLLLVPALLAQLVACLGLHLGFCRFDSHIRHIISLVVCYW